MQMRENPLDASDSGHFRRGNGRADPIWRDFAIVGHLNGRRQLAVRSCFYPSGCNFSARRGRSDKLADQLKLVKNEIQNAGIQGVVLFLFFFFFLPTRNRNSFIRRWNVHGQVKQRTKQIARSGLSRDPETRSIPRPTSQVTFPSRITRVSQVSIRRKEKKGNTPR